MKPSRATTLALLSTLAAVVASAGPELGPAPRLPADQPRRRPDGPPNRSREEARRRRQMAAKERAEASARCARGEHRAAGESMPEGCADCGVDWADIDGACAEEGGEA